MVRASLAVCVLLGAAPSCPDLYSLATHGFSVPTVDAATATAALDPAGVRITVQFTARNSNPFPISLSSVDYQVSLQGQPAFAGTQSDPQVPEHGSATLALDGVIETAAPMYRTLRPGQSVPYTISGTAHVNSPAGVPVDVEFEGSGAFTVPSTLPTP
jgi:late embryogenesis abundant protein